MLSADVVDVTIIGFPINFYVIIFILFTSDSKPGKLFMSENRKAGHEFHVLAIRTEKESKALCARPLSFHHISYHL